MAYLGVTPAVGYSKIEKQTITGNGGTTYTLTYPVGNEQEIEVYVNNVRQEPGVAYTTFGTTLTMTGVVSVSDSFYVVYQGKAEQLGSIIPEKQADGYVFASNVSITGSVNATSVLINGASVATTGKAIAMAIVFG